MHTLNAPLPFPLFEPDKSTFNFRAGDNLLNCIPVEDGWGGMPSLEEVSDELPAACVGAFFARESDGTFHVFAGTASNLYKLNTSTTPYSWDEISKSTDAYTVPSGDKWSFAQFGDIVYAAHLGDVLQSYDLTSSSQFADVSNSPQAKQITVIGDFLVAVHLDGAPTTVQWSALNDPTSWTAGLNWSDIQVRPNGGDIQSIIGHPDGGLIIHRDAMEYMNFNPGSGYAFTFSSANPARGTISPYSVGNIGPGDFCYLSEDGFFRGVSAAPIGSERVDRWFQEQIDRDYFDDIRAVVDPYSHIVWWRFYTNDAVNKLIGYHWTLDRWCYSDQQIEETAPLTKAAVPWDALDDLYDTIDDADAPFDSRLFRGGAPTYAAFTTDHKLAYFTGANKAATLESADVSLIPGSRAFVRIGRIETDCTNYTAQIGVAAYHGDTMTFDSAVSPSSRTGRIPFRADGYLHSLRMNIPAGETWSIVSNSFLEFEQSGMQ